MVFRLRKTQGWFGRHAARSHMATSRWLIPRVPGRQPSEPAARRLVETASARANQTLIVRAGTYRFDLGNPTGDADLYVRVGAPPTATSYYCRPAKAGGEEICRMRGRHMVRRAETQARLGHAAAGPR